MIGVVAAVVVGLLVAILVTRSGSDSPDDRRTAWQRVMDATPESGEATLEMARQAFSLAFEPLPGVAVPAGRSGDVTSGTLALSMVVSHWAELSHEEQAIVLAWLQPTQDQSTSVEESAGSSGFASVGLMASAGAPTAPRAGPDKAKQAAIATTIATYRVLMEGHVGTRMRGEVKVFYNSTTRTEGPGTAPAAYTLPHSADQIPMTPVGSGFAELTGHAGLYAGCYIWLNPYGWKLESTDLEYVLAHELFHCFQGLLAPDLRSFHDSAGWVLEGSANWAAAQVVPTSTYPSDFWSEYLFQPTLPLHKQSYEAVGFWNHLDESTALDPWRMVKGTLGRSSPEAFASAGGTEIDLLNSWGSSFFRQSVFGQAWNTSGATMPSIKVSPEVVRVRNGGRFSRSAAHYANAVLYADVKADVVLVVAQGHVNMHNEAESVAQFGQRVYCARTDECPCPPGSANTQPPPPPLGGSQIALGVTGGLKGAAVALAGISLADWCKKSNPPLSRPQATPPGPPAAPGAPDGSQATLCREIVERLGMDGLLSHPTMTPKDIESCITQILASGGFPPRP
jgi:hypothetical protein